MVQRNIGKIVSEIVPAHETVVFSKLCSTKLCVKKRHIEKSFCFGFSLIFAGFSTVF